MPVAFIGLDLGTSGMRGIALSETGDLIAKVSDTWVGVETNPHRWYTSLQQSLAQLNAQLSHYTPVAISACSTSGSILPVNNQGVPLADALLYNDPRAQIQAQQLGVSLSWGLCRWLWWKQTDPDQYKQSYLIHPADYLLQCLGANRHITDHTCALKSGFDLKTYTWPATRFESYGLDLKSLPQVVAPGTPIGTVSSDWSLGADVMITAGCTDGCAGQLATGAGAMGDSSTSLGTTLIFKGVSSVPIQTPDGAVYSHLHPDRTAWLPGAASSCGGGVLNHYYPRASWSQLDQQALKWLPTGAIAYPLVTSGERFPISDPNFPGLLSSFEPGSMQFYANLLEGVALVERLGLDQLASLGCDQSLRVYTTGGASYSSVWLQIRASCLNRPLVLSKYPQPAIGAAILAASGWWHCSVETAVQRLVKIETIVDPNPTWTPIYEEVYQRLLDHLKTSVGQLQPDSII